MQQPPPNQFIPPQQWPQQPMQPGYTQPHTYYSPQPPQPFYPQQPYPSYPQPYPPYQPYQQPPPPPKKKSHKTLFIVLGVILTLFLVSCVGLSALVAFGGGLAAQQAANQTATQVAQLPTTQPATQPPVTGTWTTTHSFSGNGYKKTAIFTVPNDWKIVWSCQGFNDGSGIDGALGVVVTGTDNAPIDVAVNATCKAGATKTTGETEEHQGGQVYLDVSATGDWTVQVQELK